MNKIGLLLFGRFATNGNGIDNEIQQSIDGFKLIKSELDIHFVGFGPYVNNINILNNNFTLDQNLDIKIFQKTIASKLEKFLDMGYNKTLISSCCYRISNDNFLDKNLLIVTYDNNFQQNKTINHRFMYGRTSLLKRIWENKPFIITKDLDQNLFLNTFNVVGISKMNENKIEMNNFLTRIGWLSE